MTNALQNLPPEMQQRIAQIMSGQAPAESPHQAAIQQPVQQPEQQTAPPVKPPSLMDHVIALRHEVAALRQENAAQSNVIEGVGQAVGAIYQMFHQTPTSSDQGASFGQNFQMQQNLDTSDF